MSNKQAEPHHPRPYPPFFFLLLHSDCLFAGPTWGMMARCLLRTSTPTRPMSRPSSETVPERSSIILGGAGGRSEVGIPPFHNRIKAICINLNSLMM